jgi:DNA-binding transcriptional ArsR family regulator
MKVCTINESQWKIEFTYSPLFEMLCSIHVLMNSKHHLDRITWAEDMKSKMPNDFFEELIELGRATCDWCVIMDFCNIHEECDDFNVIVGLDFIDDLSIDAFKIVFQKYKDLSHINFNDHLKKRMVRILKEYYLIYFEKELRFIEPLLIRSIKRDSEVCNRNGVLSYVNQLHSRIEVTEEAFLFHKFTLFTVPFNTLKRIIIRVSSFINPHLLMDYGADMVQFTTVTCLDKKVEKVPIDLLKLMKALSDETRLKIIRKIYKTKVSTQSLAIELNLTEACISKHLKLLFDAELLYKERSGNYIYYYLNSFFIDRIPLGIYEYLDF